MRKNLFHPGWLLVVAFALGACAAAVFFYLPRANAGVAKARVALATPTLPPTVPATSTPRPLPTATALTNPLTGLVTTDRDIYNQHPIAVQIDNFPVARPQSGISVADLVYETPTEAQLTRFTAFFLGENVQVIGPIRSGRLVDQWIVPEYHAVLLHVGGSQGTMGLLHVAHIPLVDLAILPANLPYQWRSSANIAPWNDYSNIALATRGMVANGVNTPVTLHSLPFGDLPHDAAVKDAARVSTVTIPYAYGPVTWVYSPRLQYYTREVYGAVQYDPYNGYTIHPHNVIIQYVRFSEMPYIEDVLGEYSLQVQMLGSGRGVMLRNGVAVPVTWKHDHLTSYTSYVDANGNALPLNPGTTWVELVPDTWSIPLD